MKIKLMIENLISFHLDKDGIHNFYYFFLFTKLHFFCKIIIEYKNVKNIFLTFANLMTNFSNKIDNIKVCFKVHIHKYNII